MSTWTTWALVSLVVAFTASCSDEAAEDAAVEGDVTRECSDGRDNDGNGLVDCADPGCESNALCSANTTDTADQDTDLSDVSADSSGDTGDSTDTQGSDADDTSDDPGDGDQPDSPDGVDDTGPDARSCAVSLRFDPPGTPTSVNVGGSWNGFSESADRLSNNGAGEFSIALTDLEPGEYAYKFIVDGVWEENLPADVYTQWDGGLENRSLRVGDCTRPLLEVLDAWSGADEVGVRLRFIPGVDGFELDPDSLVATIGNSVVSADISDDGTITVVADGLPSGKHSIRVFARDSDGRLIEEAPFFLPLWAEGVPFVWQDATMYFVFTDRFRNADFESETPIAVPVPAVPEIANYQGGDFLGVIQAIEEGYFDDLGANLLWLSPVYENPDGDFIAADRIHDFTGFHGYWPTEGRGIEFRFGDVDGSAEARLHQLIDTAHEHGIRVLFDLVLNHVHQEHEYISEHPQWFTAAACPCTDDPGDCNWNTNPLFCWFIDYLPDLNYRNHDIVRQLAADVEWFATEYDVDGFRVDAAKHMDHVIMRRLSLRLRDRFETPGGAEFYLVGETFVGQDGHGLIMDYVAPYELDGQFDFPLMWPIRSVWVGDSGFDVLADRVNVGITAYADAYTSMSPFLGNHDIARMATLIHSGDVDPWANTPDPMDGDLGETTWNVINRMSQAFAFVLTQPGVPLIYYGDEIGLHGGPDPDNRRPMQFDTFLSEPQAVLLGRIQDIGQARRDHQALRRGSYRELWRDSNAYVYARDNGAGDVVIVAMYKNTTGGESGRTWSVTIPEDLGLGGTTLTDVLNTDSPRSITVTGDNSATFTLTDWEYVILVRDE